MTTKHEGLYSISKVAKTCSISRSTIMRLEDRGLIKPAQIKEGGSRYYDGFNISKILRIKEFQEMGFTLGEIDHYYDTNGDLLMMIKRIEDEISDKELFLSNLALKIKAKKIDIKVGYTREVHCVTSRIKKDQDHQIAMEELFFDCVKKGYKLAMQPLFLIDDQKNNELIVCVALENATDQTITIKKNKAIFCIWDDMENEKETLAIVDRYIEDNGYEKIDDPRIILRFKDDDLVIRSVVMPIKE